MSTSSLPEYAEANVPAGQLTRGEQHPEPLPASPWPFPFRLALYATTAYFVLLYWTSFFQIVPFTAEWIAAPYDKLWNAIVPRVATAVFHVKADVQPNGSGDTTWSYVQVAIAVALALVIGAVWALLVRKRSASERTFEIFRTFLRFVLAVAMVNYGVYKVIQLQFPKPWLERLVQPYGTSSPMGILWTFMGVSRAYNFFAGAAEMLAGLLLTMRRTTLAGALLAIAVMGNIVALNFCYDVPVKLYSMQLLLMAFIIALPDARRLITFLFRSPQKPLFRRPSLQTVSLVLRTLLVTAFLVYSFYDANQARHQGGDLAPRSPLRGIWNVDELTENGAVRPPLVTDVTRWRRVVYDHPTLASILLMNDVRERYMVKVDERKKTVYYTSRDLPKTTFTIAYTRPNPDTLVLDGLVRGRQVHAICHRSRATDLLLTRGFHWINEIPFNR